MDRILKEVLQSIIEGDKQMNCDTDETRATKRLYNRLGTTDYCITLYGEDKDKVIGILNRLKEAKNTDDENILKMINWILEGDND